MTVMHAATIAALLGPAGISAVGPPTLFWASTGGPGETLVIGKSGDCPAPCTCIVTLLKDDLHYEVLAMDGSDDTGAVTSLELKPAQVSNTSLMLPLPASLPLGAYSIVAAGSAPLIVNRPDIWWIQGDGGNRSSVGGWLRVFGRNIALGATDGTQQLEARAAADAIAAAARRGDFETVEKLATAQTRAAPAVRANVTIILMDTLTNATLSPIPATNSSSVDALFSLIDVPRGTYDVR